MSDTPLQPGSPFTKELYDTHVANAWALKNPYLASAQDQSPLPVYAEARALLPDPFWAGHAPAIACYWRAWELAFGSLKRPTPENNFASNYCDTAFNGNFFMWDSSFITCFGGYGRRAFDFQKTLDNFYRKQHPDGYICREISETDGSDTFSRFDPAGTGPNVLAWAEWNDYLKTADRARLERVFPALVAYHQWLRSYHTWQDGSYWSTGWGTGMDNLPRLGETGHPNFSHGSMTWNETTFQAILSARMLLQIGAVLGQESALEDMRAEIDALSGLSNRTLWDAKKSFYFDRFSDGSLSSMKHIGAYWALLAGCVPTERLPGFLNHLENPAEFNRAHRIPALSADDPAFSPTGDYWCGGVWAPTNYMVLKGLDASGQQELAYRIALNHNENVVRVFEKENTPWTGAEQFRQYFHLTDLQFDDHHTLWENYAPDDAAPGSHSKPGYVGWTGIPPVAVLLEDIFGLTPNAPANRLTWHIRRLEEHGVRRYPLGLTGTLDLKCRSRESQAERPAVEIYSDIPFTLELIWGSGNETIPIGKGNQSF